MKQVLLGSSSNSVKKPHECGSISASDDVLEDSQQHAFGSEDDGGYEAAYGQGTPKIF